MVDRSTEFWRSVISALTSGGLGVLDSTLFTKLILVSNDADGGLAQSLLALLGHLQPTGAEARPEQMAENTIGLREEPLVASLLLLVRHLLLEAMHLFLVASCYY